MIQDISPRKLINTYHNILPEEGDPVFIFDEEGRVLLGNEGGRIVFTRASEAKKEETVYLFAIDEKRFFLALDGYESSAEGRKTPDKDYRIPEKGFEYYTIREVRDRFTEESNAELYAVFTAWHLWKWYSDNRFCGKCGRKLTLGTKERSLICAGCDNTVYPRINPAVIVGVTKGDCLLLTRYRRGYGHNALVAGFAEIGETLEETVKREVMEETGVEVTNIRYYKSQPWGMAQDILVGFYCDALGDGTIHMDENELKYAEWVKRENIELQPNNLSLTNEMMKVFKEGGRM